LEPLNYYTLLGVDQHASVQDVRQAYRRLARHYHPDLHPNDPFAATMMCLLNEAIEVLSNEAKRTAYDHAQSYVHIIAQVDEAQSFGSSRAATHGYDVTYPITITHAEARCGTHHALHFHNSHGQPYAIVVAIVPGTCSGTRLCFKEQGGPGVDGGRRGDLYVTITVMDRD
jgi:curved DNA-binding protein